MSEGSVLTSDYRDLSNGLGEMDIDENVRTIACYVASRLLANSIPIPFYSLHGPDSVVFIWVREAETLYLTISSDYLSVLLSSPEKIKTRIQIPTRVNKNEIPG